MEPQHNYPSYNAGFQQQVYGRKRSKKGCFAAGIIIVLLIISGSLFLAYFIYNKTNNTLEEITEKFGYTNADNAKNQKYKCLKRLKKMFFDVYGKNGGPDYDEQTGNGRID